MNLKALLQKVGLVEKQGEQITKLEGELKDIQKLLSGRRAEGEDDEKDDMADGDGEDDEKKDESKKGKKNGGDGDEDKKDDTDDEDKEDTDGEGDDDKKEDDSDEDDEAPKGSLKAQVKAIGKDVRALVAENENLRAQLSAKGRTREINNAATRLIQSNGHRGPLKTKGKSLANGPKSMALAAWRTLGPKAKAAFIKEGGILTE